jgi:hypothetical protein
MRPKSFERHLLICCMQVCVLVAVQLEHCTQGGAWHVGREEEGVERVHKCANNEVCANLERVKSFSHLTLPSLAPSLAPSLSSPTLQHPDPPSLSLSPASLARGKPNNTLDPSLRRRRRWWWWRRRSYSIILQREPGRLRSSKGASIRPHESAGCSPVSGGRTIDFARVGPSVPEVSPARTALKLFFSGANALSAMPSLLTRNPGPIPIWFCLVTLTVFSPPLRLDFGPKSQRAENR